jgi:hypothetical protein
VAKEANWLAILTGSAIGIVLILLSVNAISDKMKSPYQRMLDKQLEQIK